MYVASLMAKRPSRAGLIELSGPSPVYRPPHMASLHGGFSFVLIGECPADCRLAITKGRDVDRFFND
jgi:hypothetical protein